ncbi:MAG: zinc ribbon domain-containing protein [Deltaproteobacteria bacterium]|jgi:hypothetical protein|nr:zinc ribbon domain-containing protein [Deltaproteobacteria bacterium]
MSICKNCGANIDYSDNFCQYCGTKAEIAIQRSPNTPPAPAPSPPHAPPWTQAPAAYQGQDANIGAPLDPEKILSEISLRFRASEEVYVFPTIPAQKLNNVIQTYAGDTHPAEVLLLVDDTVFGSAKDGAILTKDFLYYKEILETGVKLHLRTLEYINCNGLTLKNGEQKLIGFSVPSKNDIQQLVEVIKILQRYYHGMPV